jgi:hypothetical protein
MKASQWVGAAVVAFASVAGAQVQTWIDGTVDKTWSTNAANWDAGAAWVNGNSAIFSGGAGTRFGEAVDVAATVTVANGPSKPTAT